MCQGLNIFSLKKKQKKKHEDSFGVFSKDISITEQEVVLVTWNEEKVINRLEKQQHIS